jgi:magnesium transporter
VRVLTSLDRAAIQELRERDEFFWLDLESPTDDQVDELRDLFGFHPLAIEDTENFGQRPKLDSYGDYVLVVFYGASPNTEDPELIEVHIYISGSYVVTVRRAHCETLAAARERLKREPSHPEQFVVYRIFDALTDSFFPVLAVMDQEIDELEDQIAVDPSDQARQRLFRLKRRLVELRQVVAPQRDVFARAFEDVGSLPGLEPGNRDYFRDVYDHLIRISEQIDSYRDLLTSAMDVYLSTVSNRLNTVMKQLTIVATIFLPLTFVTGFFGQNFGWMVDHIDTLAAFLLLAGGGVLIPVIVMLVLFKRSGYF